jgi:excisionase family DNA binding protein
MTSGIKGRKLKRMETRRFLNVKQLADYINVSTSLIYKRVSSQTIPFIKNGSRTIFDRLQIDQWVINGCRMDDRLPNLPSVKK